jgi:hypothetical protein
VVIRSGNLGRACGTAVFGPCEGTDKLTPLCRKVLPLSLNYAIVAFSQDTKAPCLKVR